MVGQINNSFHCATAVLFKGALEGKRVTFLTLFTQYKCGYFICLFLSNPAEGRGELMLAALDIPLWSCHYSASLISQFLEPFC